MPMKSMHTMHVTVTVNSNKRVICIAPPTGRPRARHKTIISLFSCVHGQTRTRKCSVGDIRYDTRYCFNVRWKAVQLNQLHGLIILNQLNLPHEKTKSVDRPQQLQLCRQPVPCSEYMHYKQWNTWDIK